MHLCSSTKQKGDCPAMLPSTRRLTEQPSWTAAAGSFLELASACGLTMAPLGCQKTRPGPAVSLMLNRLSSFPSFRWSLHTSPRSGGRG